MMTKALRKLRFGALLPLLLLGGCSPVYRLFHPVGPVAGAEWRFTMISTGIMLLIILPTTFATILFAFRYRKVRRATYDPGFSHSLVLEFLMWGVPLVIVVILTFCTYASVFDVNPAGPDSLNGADKNQAPLQVDVITTDWQWIFVYPQLRIATIDDLVVPAGQNVQLELTSATVTNDFYIPQVAPMIDVMPGMRTLDAFRVNKPGSYEGFSADFSGAGFSWMQFTNRIMAPADFAAWVAQTKAAPGHLDFAAFQKIAQPTINKNATPQYFSNADPNLFVKVYNAIQQGQTYPVPEQIDTKGPGLGAMPNGLDTAKPKS